jgi:hypothetical protein
VVSSDSESIHVADKDDILDASETWQEVTSGFVAGKGPTAIVSVSPRDTFIVGKGGYVYFSANILDGVTVQDAGVATVQDLNDVDAINARYAVAVGAANAVIFTQNGGDTWASVTGPAVGVALLRLDEQMKDHPVTVALPPDLPLVPLDAVLMEEVFINLLENAAKYTPAGTPVEITAQPIPGAVQVTVADRGPGLPPGEESRIFEKFYRAPDAEPGKGVGLGLTICRGIITAHGGRIWAEPRPGGGTQFHFTLPLSGPAPPPIPVEPVEPLAPEAA